MGAFFGIYEILTAFYKDGREDNYVYVSEALVAGMAVAAIESIVSSPVEIKLRAQVASTSRIPRTTSITENKAVTPLISKLPRGYAPEKMALNNSVALLSILSAKHPNLACALQEYPWMMTGSGKTPSVCDVQKPSNIVSLEGWGALWRGLRPGVVQDSIYGGIFFSSWQFLHHAMLNWKAVGMDPFRRSDEKIEPLSHMVNSLAAGFSGSIAAAASDCFDTAKSRSQCTVLPRWRLLKWRRPGNWFERVTGIHPADRNVLFQGIWLRMARSGLASFMIVGSYYLAVDHLLSE